MVIHVTNIEEDETIFYSLALLAGTVHPLCQQGIITVYNKQSDNHLPWPVVNGNFRALVELAEGDNEIQLCHLGEVLQFRLRYENPRWKKFVRPIYIKCCDDEGQFQCPDNEDSSVESAVQRISLASQLSQTFTAEKMHEHGFGRKTFQLEHNSDGKPKCHVFTSKLTVAEVHAMSGNELWTHFAKEFMTSDLKDKEHCKWFAFMSFTRYSIEASVIPKSHSDILKNTKGHTALGGGGLALYGTGNLHTWAERLEDVVTRFTDCRKIDRSKLMDDSAYREYYWANYSTGLGASLHELGHTFDLAHTPTGVMARGFDDLYRVFITQPMGHLCRAGINGSHRIGSPIPYSPRQSPLCRSRDILWCYPFDDQLNSPKPNSPKPCPVAMRPISVPLLSRLETGFRRLPPESTQVYTVCHYDGTEVKKSVTRHKDGMETIVEVTAHPSGEKVTRETIHHVISGQTRTVMSMSSSSQGLSDSPSPSTQPAHLPRTPAEDSNPGTSQEIRYKDGGAHWYRSSAVLLRYHKWFNAPCADGPGKPPHLQGNCIISSCGLRLVELRHLPDSVVFHHWEFLQEKPPHQFRLKRVEIAQMAGDAEEISVVAEDSNGNFMKKKVVISQLD